MPKAASASEWVVHSVEDSIRRGDCPFLVQGGCAADLCAEGQVGGEQFGELGRGGRQPVQHAQGGGRVDQRGLDAEVAEAFKAAGCSNETVSSES